MSLYLILSSDDKTDVKPIVSSCLVLSQSFIATDGGTLLEEEEDISRHLLRIFVACTSCAPPMPVHSSMLSIHALAGLPRLLFPGTRPVITAFSILNDSCLIMCLKYPSFLAFTLFSNSG